MKRRHTPTVVSSFALALSACLLAGCPGEGNGNEGGSNSERAPYRDGWQVVADEDFIHIGDDGVAQIFDLTVGGRESNNNFANRGDIIVNFDGPADRLLIEFRRFSFGPSQESAETDYDALSLWAFDSKLDRPQDLDAEDDCIASGWQSGCEIRVYYDGMSQLRRSGADIRVTLPSDYRQKITVITEDNLEDDDYFNRGSVCINNLFASANVETQSGNVWVKLNRDTYPSPKCSQEQIDACENWTVDDGMTPAPWAPECDCIAVGGGEFGLLAIDNRSDAASDIVVDIPAGLWSSINAQNKGDSQETAGDHCEAAVTVPNAVQDDTGNDFPWQAKFSANYPGEPAIMGAGFTIQATSNACSPVAYTEDPADFVGVGNGKEQTSAERGNVEVCSDCIVASCDELIP